MSQRGDTDTRRLPTQEQVENRQVDRQAHPQVKRQTGEQKVPELIISAHRA